MLTITRYPSGALHTVEVNFGWKILLPVVLIGGIATLGFWFTVFCLVHAVLVVYTLRLGTKVNPTVMKEHTTIAILLLLPYLLLPVILCCDEDARGIAAGHLKSLVSNKTYYLRSPIVFPKMEHESPNKAPLDLAAAYRRPRTRH